MIMEIIPTDRHPITPLHNITLPVILIRATLKIALKLIMIDPNPRAILNRNPIIPQDEPDAKVSHNDIGCVDDGEA